jgi:hypothetical protein
MAAAHFARLGAGSRGRLFRDCAACLLAWPNPPIVGPVLMVFAIARRSLANLTPDRSPNLWDGLYGAAGILVAACLVEIGIRAKRRWDNRPVAFDGYRRREPLKQRLATAHGIASLAVNRVPICAAYGCLAS